MSNVHCPGRVSCEDKPTEIETFFVEETDIGRVFEHTDSKVRLSDFSFQSSYFSRFFVFSSATTTLVWTFLSWGGIQFSQVLICSRMSTSSLESWEGITTSSLSLLHSTVTISVTCGTIFRLRDVLIAAIYVFAVFTWRSFTSRVPINIRALISFTNLLLSMERTRSRAFLPARHSRRFRVPTSVWRARLVGCRGFRGFR